MELARQFRNLHDDAPLVVANPWDVGSAVLFQSLGFDALATTSSGMAFSLGQADGTVTPAQVLAHCAAVVGAVDVPVSADLERGFGHDPAAVAETIRAAASVGLAGGSIEDATGDPDRPIYERRLAIERIEAAVEARNGLDGDFVLTARCENLLWGSEDVAEVISTLVSYQEAGADVVYAPGLSSLPDISRVCAALDVPVNVVLEMPTRPSVAQLAEAGVGRISVGSVFARLAYGTVVAAARSVRAAGSFDVDAELIGYDELEQLFVSARASGDA